MEKMAEGSEEHKQWLKHLQWSESESDPSRFHFFFKVLMPGFRQRLALPRFFVREFGEKLSSAVVIRGPSADTWTVRLKQREDDKYLEPGWPEFVRCQSLDDFYLLLFRYDERDSALDITVFDRSGCEKEANGPVERNDDVPRVHLFHRVLARGFHKRLAIPSKIASIFGETLSQSPVLVLKGPDGNAWELGLSKDGDSMFLECGWQDFAEGHSLEESDLLVFRYDEWDDCLHVLIFDKTACEKEGFEFSQRGAKERSNVHDHDVVEKMSEMEVTSSTEAGAQAKVQPDPNVAKASGKGHVGESVVHHSSSHEGTHSEKPAPREEAKSKVKLGSTGSHKKERKTYHRYYQSHRRPVTKGERDRAIQSAYAFKSSKTNFIAVMQPSNVYYRFYLTLPVGLVRKNLSRRPKIAFLRVPPSAKAWTVTIIYTSDRVKAGISGGWAEFVMDRNLEEGDACLFELHGSESDNSSMACAVNFDVRIFRVVDDIVPLVRVGV